MGKGSSGGGTNTVVQQSQPNPQMLADYQQVYNQAQGVAATPFQTPQAPVASMNSNTIAGIQGVDALQGVTQPYLNAAQGLVSQSQTPLMPTYQPYATAATNDYGIAGNTNLTGAYNPWAGAASNAYGAGAGANLVGTYQPYGSSATGLYNQSAAGSINPETVNAAGISQYMSPYNQAVVGTTEQQFANTNAQQQANIVGNAASAGAWGGDRSAAAQALTAGQQQTAEAPVIAGLENQNYAQALQEANVQQQAGIGVQEATRQLEQGAAAGISAVGTEQTAAAQQQAANQFTAAQGYAGIGAETAALTQQQAANQLAAAQGISQVGQTALGAQEAQGWLASQGAFAEGNIGNEALSQGLTESNAMLGTGQTIQSQQQAEMNAPYYQQLAQQAYPFQTTQYLANIAEGVGSQMGGTGTTTSPGPSAASQIGGLGIAGLGTYGLLNSTGALGGIESGIGSLFGGGAGADVGAAALGSAGLFDAAGAGAGALEAGLGSAALFGFEKGGEVPRRPMGGGISAAAIPGPGAGIPGVVDIVPGTSPTPGGGPPRAPAPFQEQPAGQQLGQEAMQAMQMARLGQAPVQQPPPASGGSGDGMAIGGGLPRMRQPRVGFDRAGLTPHMGGIGGYHAFHPSGLPRLQSGGIIDQTTAEVAAQQQAQQQAQAMQMSMAEMGPQGIGAAYGMPQYGYAEGGGVDDSPVVINDGDASFFAPHGPAMSLGYTPSTMSGYAPPPGLPGGQAPRITSPVSAPAGGPNMSLGYTPPTMSGLPGPPPLPIGAASEIGMPSPGGYGQGIGTAALRGRVPQHHASTLPQPPVPPDQGIAGATPGAVEVSAVPHDAGGSGGIGGTASRGTAPMSNSDIWTTVLAAGLGMMSGTSPHAGTNIGRGAMEGLQFGAQQQKEHAAEQARQQQLEQTGQYQTGELKLKGQEIEQTGELKKAQMAQTQALEQARMAQELQVAKMHIGMEGANLAETRKYHQELLDQGKYTWAAGMGPDPSDPTKQTAGMYRLPSKGNEEPQFLAGQTLTAKSPSGAAMMPPDVTNMIAQQVVAGNSSALSGLGYGTAGAQARIAVQTAVTQQLHDQGHDGTDLAAKTAEYMGEKAGARAAGTREANVGMAVNEAQKFMPLALEASARVDRTAYPTLNSIMQAYEKHTGDENIVRLAVATASLTNAYGRAVTPGNQPTEGATLRARELLDQAWGKGQYAAAVDQLSKEMAAAKASPIQEQEEQRARISGHPAQATRITPPQAAIDMLRQNPHLAAQFDAKYGIGASSGLMGP